MVRRAGALSPITVLQVLTLGLVAVVVAEIRFDWSSLVESGSTAPPPVAGSSSGSEGVDLAALLDEAPQYEDYFKGPVLSRDRRPLTLIGQSAARGEDGGNDSLALLGTVITDGARVALIRSARSNEIFRGRLGDEVAGWTIVELEANQVRLRRDGENALLALPSMQGVGRGPGER